jgi:tRNA A37 threonylcarbamoyltransferase TsaD
LLADTPAVMIVDNSPRADECGFLKPFLPKRMTISFIGLLTLTVRVCERTFVVVLKSESYSADHHGICASVDTHGGRILVSGVARRTIVVPNIGLHEVMITGTLAERSLFKASIFLYRG